MANKKSYIEGGGGSHRSKFESIFQNYFSKFKNYFDFV